MVGCSFSSFLIPNKQTDLIPVAQADINIFTVASGLLYEVSSTSVRSIYHIDGF